MPAQAVLKFARVQPNKVRIVGRLICGKPLAEAESILAIQTPRAARILRKVLRSAAANAENNHELDRNALVVRSVRADTGPSFGRLKPRARGRADVIRRRFTHITIVLDEREASRRES